MKRVLAIAIVALLFLSIVPTVSATNDVYFSAANDAVLDLTDDTMPVWSGGMVYVPYTVFSGTNLGVFFAQNQTSKTFTLYNIQKTLTFDLNTASCYDQDSTSYSYRAIVRNSKTYLPISFVSNFFGLTYSYLKTDIAPLIRIRSADAVLSDSVFVTAASQLMQYRLNQYSNSQNGQETPPPVVSSTPSPSTSDNPGTSGKSNVRVYLAFDGCPSKSTDKILDALDEYGYKATFYFDPDKLDGADGLILRIIGSGHAIGLSGNANDSAETLLFKMTEGNRRLKAICYTQTRIVSIPEMSEQQYQTLTQAGYCCWNWSINAVYEGATSYRTASNAIRKIADTSLARVRFSDGEIASGAMPRILQTLKIQGYRVRLITETAYR